MALRRLPIVFEFVPVSSYEEAHLLPSLLPPPPFPGSALQVPPGLELLDGVHNGLGLAVYFNVHDASDGLLTQRRNPQRLGDEVKVEFPLVVAHLAHRQRDPVDRDVPLGQDVLCILWVSQPDPKPHVPVSRALLLAKRRGGVHVSRNVVPADLIADPRGALEVARVPQYKVPQVRPAEGLCDDVELEFARVAQHLNDGEARAVDRDGGAHLGAVQAPSRKLERQRPKLFALVHT
mmetsp:Transcript_4406/g.15459  ORF Transcript_4406/g.15459 Transcript_4406/m.15459 type:complete len:235 (+) Transcript_4406:66-770(+)